MNRTDGERLDETLHSLDVLAPPARVDLQAAVERAFERHGPRPRRWTHTWLPATVCAAAAAIAWLLVTASPKSPGGPAPEPAARVALRVAQAGRTVADLELRLLGRRLQALESELGARPEASPVDPPEPTPAPLLEDAAGVPHKDQVALVRLALLEQSDVRVLGVEGLRQRLDELAGTYEGTVAGRRAREWAERLNP